MTLPPGFEVRLRRDVVRADGGRVLIGGSPVRAVRLSARAQRLLRTDRLIIDGAASAVLARRLLAGNLADPFLDDVQIAETDLTVVVPVRDRPDQLDRCLAALRPLQVLVVDDASRHPAAVADVARRHAARLVCLTDNAGPAGARNAGLALVSTPLVAFVDSDVTVESDVLVRLARHCADPEVALVGPLVAGYCPRSRARWFERYEIAAASLDLGRIAHQVQPGAAVSWLPSACLVGRVDALGSGFDPTLWVGEDVDLVWRLIDRGLVVRYDPTLVARHDIRPTVRSWLGRKFVYGTGGGELGVRHPDKIAPAVLSPTVALGAAALLVCRWWSVPVATAALAVTSRALQRHLPVTERGVRLSLHLSVRGLGWAVRQESGLLLRHWWPATLAGSLVSRHIRRAVLSAVLVDLVVLLRERDGIGPLTALVAKRLDDLAYGAGLWWGAITRRDLTCLAVRRPAREPNGAATTHEMPCDAGSTAGADAQVSSRRPMRRPAPHTPTAHSARR